MMFPYFQLVFERRFWQRGKKDSKKKCILGHPSSMAGLPKDIKPPQLLLSILDALSTYTDKQRE